MKQQMILLISVFMLGFTSCKKDKCDTSNCLNGGTCDDGRCDCPIGYTGSECEEQITPQSIQISTIEVLKFPPTDNGGGWDISSGPEIYPEISKGTSLIWSSSNYYEDANPNINYEFDVTTSISLSEPKDEYTISLYDYDGTSSDDFMGGIRFTPYSDSNKFPSTITLGQGQNVTFKIHLSYSF